MLCTEPDLAGDPPPRCFVHDQPMPCPLVGQPASSNPVHTYAEPDQVAAVELVLALTRGSRPVTLHDGRPGDTGHITEPGKGCWCATVTIPTG
jgi:hypothetical protein